MRISVIDLGTNTFNLLIVETGEDHAYKIIYNNKLACKAGQRVASTKRKSGPMPLRGV